MTHDCASDAHQAVLLRFTLGSVLPRLQHRAVLGTAARCALGQEHTPGRYRRSDQSLLMHSRPAIHTSIASNGSVEVGNDADRLIWTQTRGRTVFRHRAALRRLRNYCPNAFQHNDTAIMYRRHAYGDC